MNASSVACQRPERDHSIDMTIIGFSVGGFTLITFIVRLVTRLTTGSHELYSDDWLMLAAVVRIPPGHPVAQLTMYRSQQGHQQCLHGF